MGNFNGLLVMLFRIQDNIPRYLLLPAALALPISSLPCDARPVSFPPFEAETGENRAAQPKVATRHSQPVQGGWSPSSRNPSHGQAGYRVRHGDSNHLDRKPALREPEVAESKGSLDHVRQEDRKQASRSDKSGAKRMLLQDHKDASPTPSASRIGSRKDKGPRSRRRSMCRAALAWLGIRMATQDAPPPKSAPTQGLAGGGGSGANKKRSGGRDSDGDDGRRSSKRLKAKKAKTDTDEKESKTRWACPFLRKDQCVHHRCGNFVMKKISHVFQHLDRIHLAEGDLVCARCGLELDTQQGYDEHIRADSCQPQAALNGMTKRQQMRIQVVKGRRGGGWSDEDKWYGCWDILFPDTPRPIPPRGPYLDHPLFEECSRMWEVLGDVHQDPAVSAGYRAGDGEAGLQQFLHIIRDAMARRILAIVHARPRPRHRTIQPLTQEHGPILQPHPPPIVAPPTRRLHRSQNRPAHSLSMHQQSLDLNLIRPQPEEPHSLDMWTQPENMAAHVQRHVASAGQNPIPEFLQDSEAVLPRAPEQGTEYDLDSFFWMHVPIRNDNLMAATELGSGANASGSMAAWDDASLLLGAPQTRSPHRAPETHGMRTNVLDVDEYVDWDGAGDNNFMPDGPNRRLREHGGRF